MQSARVPGHASTAPVPRIVKPSLTLSFRGIVKELSVQCHRLVPATSLLRRGSIERAKDVEEFIAVDARENGLLAASREPGQPKDLGAGMALLIQAGYLTPMQPHKSLC